MAALNQERFTPATDDTIEELRNGAKNVNTSKSTSFWLSVWKTWCEGKSIALEIEEHEPANLNTLLEKFYAEVNKDMIFPHFLHANFLTFMLLISNHKVFLVQLGINLLCKFFKKLKLHSPPEAARSISAF